MSVSDMPESTMETGGFGLPKKLKRQLLRVTFRDCLGFYATPLNCKLKWIERYFRIKKDRPRGYRKDAYVLMLLVQKRFDRNNSGRIGNWLVSHKHVLHGHQSSPTCMKKKREKSVGTARFSPLQHSNTRLYLQFRWGLGVVKRQPSMIRSSSRRTK